MFRRTFAWGKRVFEYLRKTAEGDDGADFLSMQYQKISFIFQLGTEQMQPYIGPLRNSLIYLRQTEAAKENGSWKNYSVLGDKL